MRNRQFWVRLLGALWLLGLTLSGAVSSAWKKFRRRW